MKNVLYFIIILIAFSASSSYAMPSVLIEGENLIERDSIITDADNCLGETAICLEIPFRDIRNYEVYVDGDIYSGSYPACNIDTIYKANFDNIIDDAQAPYQLLFFEVSGMNFNITFNSFEELVDSIRIWDPISDWQYDSLNNEMSSLNPPVVNFSNRIIFRDANNNTTELSIDLTPVSNGTFFYLETKWSTLVVRDTVRDCSDTVEIGIYCADLDTNQVFVNYRDTIEFCFPDNDLLSDISSIELLTSDTLDNIELIIEDSCILLIGVNPGFDTLDFSICDDLGICDTNTVIVEVGEIPGGMHTIIYDTIFPNQTDTFCFGNQFAIDSIYNDCPELNSGFVSFEIDSATNCLIYSYELEGQDTACIIVDYTDGGQDSFTFIINSILPQINYYRDSVYVNQTDTYCLDSNELSGSIVLVEEFCQNNLNHLSYSLDSTELCIDYTGIQAPGNDTLCFRICDENMNCDTTYMILTALDTFGLTRDILDTTFINFSDTICFDSILPGDIVSITNDCPGFSDTLSYTIDTNNLCIYFISGELGLDVTCFVITDEYGNTDTNNVIILTLGPTIDTQYIELEFTEVDTICFDESELAGPLQDTVINICPELSDGNTDLRYDENGCPIFSYLSEGLDTFCLVYCDTFDICDTTVFIVNTTEAEQGKNETLRDTIYENGIDSICFTLSFPEVDSIENICPELSGTDVEFVLNEDGDICAIYNYLQIGQDTACYQIHYSNGVKDTCNIIVTSLNAEVEFIYDTLFVNQSRQYCLSDLELESDSLFSIEFCDDSLEFIVITDSINQDFCFELTGGMAPGEDTLCYRLCDSLGVCDTTYYIIYVSTEINTSEYIYDTVLINFRDTICFDTDLPGDIVNIEDICPDNNGFVGFTIDSSTYCLIYEGLALGQDTSCILIRDEFGNTDTNFVVINTVLPENDTIYIDVLAGMTDTLCLDSTELAGNMNTRLIYCPEAFGIDVSGDFISDWCFEYTGINPDEMDTLCVLICDDLGVCDTAVYIFTVLDTMSNDRDSIILDSVLINFTESICFDTLDTNGPVVSITNECPDQSGDVEFFVDTDNYCLSYTGDSIDIDTACIVIVYENGSRDSFTVIITVVPPSPDIYNIDLMIGESDTICVALDELAGFTVDSSFVDLCDTLNGENAEILLDTTDLCVRITGLTIGMDTACVIICDNFGICDTSYFYVNVFESVSMDSLDAVDDFTETNINEQVNIFVIGNDTIPNNDLSDFYIVDQPSNGSLTLDTAGFIIYNPNIDFCGADTFSYAICNNTGCDTANVYITIDCLTPEDLFIPNAFSPNGDGTGDTWVIDGIDQFPNTEVLIFNRWGNRVYKSNDYQNDWDGSWENDPLPDGTYFYKVDFRNGEKPSSGYLTILR